LRVAKLVGAFGLAQLIQLVTSLLRLPAIAQSSSVEVLGVTFLWLGLLSWSSVLNAGTVNLARLAQLRGHGFAKSSRIKRVLFRVTLILALVISPIPVLMPHLPLILSGVGPTFFGFLGSTGLARYMGILQGKGKVANIYAVNAVSSTISLIGTLLVTSSSVWQTLSEPIQVMILATLSVLSFVLPYFYAWLLTRNEFVFTRPAQARSESKKQYIYELAAVLPPAFVSGFDGLALAWSRAPNELAEYGLVSRLSLLATLVVSALYVQLNNVAGNRSETSPRDLLKDSARLVALTLPFSAAFLCLAAPMVQFLSANKIEVQTNTVMSVFALSLIIPAWIGISATLISNDRQRLILGQRIFTLVLPFSMVSTFALTYFFRSPRALHS